MNSRRRPFAILAGLAWALVSRPAAGELPAATHQTLTNGMELLFIEDHSTPLISVCLWVGVGAVDETGRTSGASHLLEHLLFDGTASRSREAIQADFDRMGGYVNAFTRHEYTAHILSVPRDMAARAIEIQADMLLASIFPEAEVAKERNVVLEEMKRDRDDPRGYSEELFERELWRGTVLEHPVIGTEAAVETIPRDDIIAYWRAHYVPDRMIAVVIGDIDPVSMRALFEKLYGRATPGFGGRDRVEPLAGRNTRQEREEYVSGGETIARFGFDAPAWNDDLAPAMEIAARILTEGDDARLARRLTAGATPLASGVEGGAIFYGSGAAMEIAVTLDDASRLAGVESALGGELRDLADKGPRPEELDRVKTNWRVADAFECDNMLYFAMGLAEWMARGGYEGRRSFSRRAMSVDAAAVREVVQRYLAPMNGLLHVTRPLPGATSPAPSTAAAVSTGETRTERRVLPNGLVVIGRENPASRVTAFHVLIGHRAALEPPGKAGLANFTVEMLAEGTASRSGDEIVRELAATGARLQVAEDPRIPFDDYYWSPDYAFVRLEVANEFAPRALGLLDDLVLHPSFPAARIDAAREHVLGLVAQEESSAGVTGRLILRQTLFPGTPWASPIRGTAASLATISREDLVAFHRAALVPGNVILTFAGGTSLDSTFRTIERDWGTISGAAVSIPPAPRVDEVPPGPGSVQHRMERDQMWIGLGHRAAGASSPAMPATILAAAALDRRLGLDLREKQGLAYSVGAGSGFARDIGWITLSLGTRTENRDRALAGLRTAMATLRSKGVTAGELELARNATLAQRIRYRQRAVGQAYSLAMNEYLGLGHDFDEAEAARFAAVTVEDVNRVAREIFADTGWVSAEVGRVGPTPSAAAPGVSSPLPK